MGFNSAFKGLIELPRYKLRIVCVYRSPDGQFNKFLNKLELVIQKSLMEDIILILCGDWNMDLLHEDGNLKNLTDLLLRYNLVNTVQSPTRIMKSTSTFIDVIIINMKNYMEPATVHNRVRIMGPPSPSVACAA